MADSPDIHAAAFESGPTAQLLIDRSGTLIAANQPARGLLHVAAADVGRPVADLDLGVRLPQLVEAAASGRVRPPEDVQWPSGLDVRILRLSMASLPAGLRLDITDVTEEAALRLDLKRTSLELAVAYQQLGATTDRLRIANERLADTVEQLEATTDELRRVSRSSV
jgi:hypothetical protein